MKYLSHQLLGDVDMIRVHHAGQGSNHRSKCVIYIYSIMHFVMHVDLDDYIHIHHKNMVLIYVELFKAIKNFRPQSIAYISYLHFRSVFYTLPQTSKLMVSSFLTSISLSI